METTIRPKNFKLAPDIEDQVQKRVDRLTHHLENLSSAEVLVSQQPARQTTQGFQYVAQVTLHTRHGDIIRSEVTHADLLTAIDQSMSRLGRQIERFRARYEKRRKGAASLGKMSPTMSELPVATDQPSVAEIAAPAEPIKTNSTPAATDDGAFTDGVSTEDDMGSIVRVKTFAFKPIFPEDAVEQMELLGHSFFVFWNASDERVNVIYRRNDGNYGLIQPEFG